MKTFNKKKLICSIGLCIVIALILEVCIMFGKSINPSSDAIEISPYNITSNVSEKIEYRENGLYIFSGGEKRLNIDVDHKIYSITLNTTSGSVVEGRIMLRDESTKYYDAYGQEFMLQPGEDKSTTIKVKSFGNANYIGIDIYKDSGDFLIESIILNQEYYPFNIARVTVIFILGLFVSFLYYKRNIIVDSHNVRGILIVICAVSIALCGFIRNENSYGNWSVEYNEQGLESNIYCYMTDSFLKGIPYLDIEVDEKLNQLENVYDRSERDKAECVYKWDYAFHDGKYYSYYETTPMFLVYIPYYFLTGMLPDSATVGLVLATLSVVALGALIYQVIKLFNLKARFPIMTCSIAAVFGGSLIFSIQSCANNLYNLNLATIFSIEMFMLMIIVLYHQKSIPKVVIFSVLTAVCAIMIVQSRPNAAIPVLFFSLPLAYKMLKSKEKSLKMKQIMLLSGGFVLLIGAFFVCKYNYYRFGNIFDFGKNYQLTAYDCNRDIPVLSITNIFNTIYYYIFELPLFSKKFPFIQLNNTPIDGQGYYLLKDPNMGLIMLPITWSVLCWNRLRNRLSRFENIIIAFSLIGSLACAYSIFSLGGVQLRYHTDYITVLLMAAFVLLIKGTEKIQNQKQIVQHTACISMPLCIFICITTCFIGFLLIFSNQFSSIKYISPEIYYGIANIFSII